jgi:hypothetical protein
MLDLLKDRLIPYFPQPTVLAKPVLVGFSQMAQVCFKLAAKK